MLATEHSPPFAQAQAIFLVLGSLSINAVNPDISSLLVGPLCLRQRTLHSVVLDVCEATTRLDDGPLAVSHVAKAPQKSR